MRRTMEVHGLPAVRLETPEGASATVTHHGAQLVSWITPDGLERLFLSERAAFGEGQAIRGGVPVCFPQFAALGPLPRHGFARTRAWRPAEPPDGAGGAEGRFTLAPDAPLLARWPHPFLAELSVRLAGHRVAIGLTVSNRGGAPLAFTAALHGYWAVDDVEAVQVEGLAGVEYRDAADGDRLRIEGAAPVRIRGEVDRVYHGVQGEVTLREGARALAFRAGGLPDVVIWSPGAAKGAALADLTDGGWRRFLCVEAAAIRTPVVVPPGGSWTGWQEVRTPAAP